LLGLWPSFNIRRGRRDGQTVTGVLEVADRGAALMQIERLGLFPLAVESPKGSAPRPPRRG
jgi:type II secretory pathway component PulF